MDCQRKIAELEARPRDVPLTLKLKTTKQLDLWEKPEQNSLEKIPEGSEVIDRSEALEKASALRAKYRAVKWNEKNGFVRDDCLLRVTHPQNVTIEAEFEKLRADLHSLVEMLDSHFPIVVPPHATAASLTQIVLHKLATGAQWTNLELQNVFNISFTFFKASLKADYSFQAATMMLMCACLRVPLSNRQHNTLTESIEKLAKELAD